MASPTCPLCAIQFLLPLPEPLLSQMSRLRGFAVTPYFCSPPQPDWRSLELHGNANVLNQIPKPEQESRHVVSSHLPTFFLQQLAYSLGHFGNYHRVGKRRFTVEMLINNTIINNNNTRINCVSCTHNCKPTFAQSCIMYSLVVSGFLFVIPLFGFLLIIKVVCIHSKSKWVSKNLTFILLHSFFHTSLHIHKNMHIYAQIALPLLFVFTLKIVI